MSFIAKSNYGVHFHGSARRNVTRRDGYTHQEQSDGGERQRILRADAEELIAHEPRQAQRCNNPDNRSDKRHACFFSEYQPQHVRALRTESYAHTNFVCALPH
jgi:hypothetical protein